MAGGPSRVDSARVIDIRRALPAGPLAVCCGLYVTYSLAGGGAPPAALLAGGVVAFAATAVALYRTASGWSETARRWIGYVTAVLLGVLVGAVLLFAAFATSFCGLWGETCTEAEEAQITRFGVAGLVAVVAVPAVYAAIDLVTARRH
jgi:hypothetical protein